MKNKVLLILLSGLCALSLFGCTEALLPETEETPSVNSVSLSEIRPQDDFYGYVNAEDLLSHDVDRKYGSYSSFLTVQQEVDEITKNGIVSIAESGKEYEPASRDYIISTIYNQMLDYETNENVKNEAVSEVQSVLDEINSAQNCKELLSVMNEIAVDYGVISYFSVYVDQCMSDPTQSAIYLYQRDSFASTSLESINDNCNACSLVQDSLRDILKAGGMDNETATENAKAFAYITLDIAWATDFDVLNSEIVYTTFKEYSESEIDAQLTNLTCSDIYGMLGITNYNSGKIIIQDLNQLIAIDKAFCDDNLEALKAIVTYEYLEKYGIFLKDVNSTYKGYYGQGYAKTVDLVYRFMQTSYPLEISDLYVSLDYNEKTNEELLEMCEDIRSGYKDLISGCEWLSDESKASLLKKLESIIFLTASDYTYEINENNLKYIGENIFETTKLSNAKMIDMQLEILKEGRDRYELQMGMNVMNACYDPAVNTVTITAAITKAPFFDADADYYTNLGGLGMVIGHEIGHAFDSSCILFDENGAYNPGWISADDVTILETKNAEAIEYFESSFAVFDVYHVDGAKTLGENYADLSSMECITSLCKDEDDYINLFNNFAVIWSELNVDSSVIGQIKEDVHSPATIRVNAILATTPSFYEIYDVSEGDGMYISPEDRISRW